MARQWRSAIEERDACRGAISSLMVQVARMRAALEMYADAGNWCSAPQEADIPPSREQNYWLGPEAHDMDGWTLARKALEKPSPEELPTQ